MIQCWQPVNEEFEVYEDEIDNLWSYLQDRGVIEGSMDTFLNVDNELATTGSLTTEEIIVSSIPQNNESEEESAEEDEQLTPVSRQQAYQAFMQFNQYVEETVKDPKLMQMCDKFMDFFEKQRLEALCQKHITDYYH
ncbi:hypothetical protein RN001_005303 [Aquatica leii]|uniref:Uncharacterized protein n=1 Tax=Aquatica leii TaxID=1421715 RepID=A0AAN7SIR9_9COLE|nr:hypothetical protein RN001_005303 [Aquatica leii]